VEVCLLHGHHLLAAHADYAAADRIPANMHLAFALSHLFRTGVGQCYGASLVMNLLLAIFFALPPDSKSK